ncbi:Ig-like domain-containing protein [Micromonospora sp. FIMYZ51]|uniref:Ig-like domain-containing protein n=1 Tax=Micromonospora sp. FIMYZ51 TaxID=3051832 RepID=UPI00311F698E
MPDPNRPLVELTRPETGDPFFAPATITMAATATPAPGRQITRVEFIGSGDAPGSGLIGTDTTAPYTAQWSALPAGEYALTAWAYDNAGAVRNSMTVLVRVHPPSERRQAPYVSVVRDQLWGVDPIVEAAAPRRLAPLARTGAESRCVHGRGIWDGPVDADAVSRLVSRGVQAVYLPLNEACWLGLPYVPPRYRGEPYQQEVTAYVHRLRAVGITPIVALAWSHGRYTGPGATCRDERALCAKPMPHATYAVDFWTSVGERLGSYESIVFDLFSTPFPDRAIDDPALAWTCWRDGDGACSALGYPVIGMQALLFQTQRHVPGVLLASGLNGGSDLSRWAAYRPFSGTYNLAAAWRPTTPGDCRRPPTLTQAPVVVTVACQ